MAVFVSSTSRGESPLAKTPREAPVVVSSNSNPLAVQIKAPLLIHYAGNDERINAGWPAYEAALKAAGKRYEAFVYAGTEIGQLTSLRGLLSPGLLVAFGFVTLLHLATGYFSGGQ
mgnify:CR=1 FL=1